MEVAKYAFDKAKQGFHLWSLKGDNDISPKRNIHDSDRNSILEPWACKKEEVKATTAV